ncbi:cytochrome C oxidase subunit II [Acidisphaera sp. S103]|uniref:cytochrome C oxidase subunit II n=1 Tax=Acidisphaera sp. S103 TaxID=1747223 RepID=UPI00131C66D5|nr:cytochrome C oxidase subunit II [Acidisphaera sp. S103]
MTEHADSATVAARMERRWGTVSIGIILALVFMAAYIGVHQGVMPQPRVETVDPRTLHIAGEFIESNLGTAAEPDGSVTVRAIGQQYSFTPQCIVVPADTQVTIRATSADVIHGFLIEHSNVNTMLVPGYISTIVTRFPAPSERLMPCHEFCGAGHEGMWGRIKVINKAAFAKLAADQRRMTCVAQ